MNEAVHYSRRLYIRRAIEIIVVEILLSTAARAMYDIGYYSTKSFTFIIAFAITAAYFIWTVNRLFHLRLYVDGKKAFYLINAPFYGVLIAGAIALSLFDTEPVYAYLFMPFKLLVYAADRWDFPGSAYLTRPVSAVIMSVVFALPVILMPVIVSTKRKSRMMGIEVSSEDEQ